MLITGFRRPALTKAHTRLILPVAALALLALLAVTQPALVPLAMLLLFAASVPLTTEIQGVVAVLALGLLALLGGAAAFLVTGSLCVLSNVSVLAFLGASSLVLWRTYRR